MSVLLFKKIYHCDGQEASPDKANFDFPDFMSYIKIQSPHPYAVNGGRLYHYFVDWATFCPVDINS